MKVLTNDGQITMLNVLTDKMLMTSNGHIYVIKEFKTIELVTITKSIFGKQKDVVNKYITSIKILAYNSQGKFVGYCTDEDCIWMLRRYLFYVMRQQWIDFNDMLNAFGYEIVKIDEEKS